MPNFNNVVMTGLAHVNAPVVLTTEEINDQLKDTKKRLGVRADLIGDIAGIWERRLWGAGMTVAQAGSQAGRIALEDAGITGQDIGLLVNTSVSRDYLEPATAAIVAGEIGVSSKCQTFDVTNACLAFINGMDIASRMIEQGEIEHALIVNGEAADTVYQKTLERLSHPDILTQDFRDQMAALTLGSGAVAMVLSHRNTNPLAHRYLGGVTRSATKWHNLCLGHLDRMYTDTKNLMIEGMRLASETISVFQEERQVTLDEFDHFVVHQISNPHIQLFMKTFNIASEKVFTLFDKHGNLGPAGVPTVLSSLRNEGKLKGGDKIAFMGIGSGLNCTVSEMIW